MTRSSSLTDDRDPLVDRLWPDDGSHERLTIRALPDAHRPRLLVPAGPPAVVRSTLRTLRPAATSTDRMRTRVALALWRTPMRPGVELEVPAGGLGAELSAALGQPLLVGAHLGPARANRKPVLALCSPDGELVAIAKVAVDPLTARLVGNETDALTALPLGLSPEVVVPRPRLTGTWHDQPYLVQTPLPIAGRRPRPDPARVAAAQRAVAHSGTVTEQDLASATYLEGLRAKMAALPDQERAGVLLDLLHRLTEAHGRRRLTFGVWHGDWRTTNMAVLPDAVYVWDWERFDAGVPVGFDALHLSLTSAAPRTPDLTTLPETLHGRAPALLAPFSVAPEAVGTVTLLYLLELATRYTADAQGRSGAPLGQISSWLVPWVRARLGP